jgi:hypothetical protein
MSVKSQRINELNSLNSVTLPSFPTKEAGEQFGTALVLPVSLDGIENARKRLIPWT